jgi:hypothetical protein
MVRQARRKSEASTHPSGWAVLHMAWEGRLKCFHNNEAVLHFIYVVLGSLQIRHIIIYPADNAEWRFCIEVPTAPERRTTRIKKTPNYAKYISREREKRQQVALLCLRIMYSGSVKKVW